MVRGWGRGRRPHPLQPSGPLADGRTTPLPRLPRAFSGTVFSFRTGKQGVGDRATRSRPCQGQARVSLDPMGTRHPAPFR